MADSGFDFGAAALGLQSFGAVNSAIGSYYAARSKESSLRFAADMADINARIAENAAQADLLAGQRQVASSTMRYGQLKGTQRASMAANGIDLGEGNAAEVQATTDIFKDLDKNQLEINALQSAIGRRTEAMNYRVNAIMNRGMAAGVNAPLSGGKTLLDGATLVASSWYQYNKTK